MTTAVSILKNIEIEDIWNSTSDEPQLKMKLVADPLLLSCVLYRLTTNPVDGVNHEAISITESELLHSHVTSQDQILADTVRNHYNNKIMLTVLRGDRVTKFRGELSQYLRNDFRKDDHYAVPTNYLGMLYKLPFFYHYDLEVNEVFGSAYHTLKSNVLNYEDDAKKLTFIKKIKSYRKGHHPNEYWFRDEKDDRIVLTVEARNSLSVLFENYLNDHKEIVVRGEFRAARKDTLEYYRTQWVLNV